MRSPTTAAGAIAIDALEPRAILESREVPAFAPGDVHAWAFGLDRDAGALGRCAALLDPAEAERARRFVFPEHRDRFVLGRGILRHVLSLYAGRDARDIGFEYGPGGKPALAGGAGSLSFNLSHSHDRALLAVTGGREVGADVERVRVEIDVLGIAGSYFFRSEIDSIRSASPGDQRARFFRYWVAKESALKGEGCGLGFPLDGFEVRFDALGETATIATFDAARMRGDWTIRMLSLGDGWPAAIAARGGEWRLRACGAAA